MLLTGIAVVLFIVFAVGIVGNSVVLFVLLKQKGSWSVATTYLFNLALADTLFICVVPFWGHYYLSQYEWAFGVGMCKLASVVTSVNMYASIFFLTAMSVDRWMAVVHATSVNLFRTSVITRWVCCSVWCAAFLLSIPRLLYQTLHPYDPRNNETSQTTAGDPSNASVTFSTTSLPGLDSTAAPNTGVVIACTLLLPKNFPNRALTMGCLRLLGVLLGFVIPMSVICICYRRIVNTVKHKVISKKVRKERVAKLAAFIVAAFFVCWLPYQLVVLYSAVIGWWTDVKFDETVFNNVYSTTICLAYSNSCINPIVYAFTTSNFQENVKEMCGSDKTRPYRMAVGNDSCNETKGVNHRTEKTALTFNRSQRTKNEKNGRNLVVRIHSSQVSINNVLQVYKN